MSRIEREHLPDIEVYRLIDIPLIHEGDNIAQLIQSSVISQGIELREKDIIVIAQKIISKAEGATVSLRSIAPSQQAYNVAKVCGRDERLVQLIFDESIEIIDVVSGTLDEPGFVVTRHRLGHVCTNAGIDRSNVGSEDLDQVVLLPQDPDASARTISDQLLRNTGVNTGVLIIDSIGDPYRLGAIGKTIGVSNIPTRVLEQKVYDINGKPITSDIAFADGVASFAMILMGQGSQAVPVVIVRGMEYDFSPDSQTRDILT